MSLPPAMASSMGFSLSQFWQGSVFVALDAEGAKGFHTKKAAEEEAVALALANTQDGWVIGVIRRRDAASSPGVEMRIVK